MKRAAWGRSTVLLLSLEETAQTHDGAGRGNPGRRRLWCPRGVQHVPTWGYTWRNREVLSLGLSYVWQHPLPCRMHPVLIPNPGVVRSNRAGGTPIGQKQRRQTRG